MDRQCKKVYNKNITSKNRKTIMEKNREPKVKSLVKAVNVLNCFLEKQPLGVTEISEMIGIHKSNVHNILSTYLDTGYVEKDPETDRYSLGPGIYRLSYALGGRFSLAQYVQPYIKELANRLGESIIVSIPVGQNVMYIGGEHPDIEGVYTRLTYIGNQNPMYCTSTGKAMLAFMDEKTRNICLDHTLEPRTEFTITSRQALEANLSLIRQRGYATDHMEFQLGLSCIAAPLFNTQRKLLGTITISGPSERIEGERAELYARELVKCASCISTRL